MSLEQRLRAAHHCQDISRYDEINTSAEQPLKGQRTASVTVHRMEPSTSSCPDEREAESCTDNRLSHRCHWRTATQQAVTWHWINDQRSIENEFTNRFIGDQSDCLSCDNPIRKSCLAHGTRISVVWRMYGRGIHWLICSNIGSPRAMIATVRR